MGWYGLEAFNSAIKRTKKSLAEPFDFWKWIRLGIIIFFIGGGGMGIPNFNFPASWQTDDRNMEAPSTQEIIGKINTVLVSVPNIYPDRSCSYHFHNTAIHSIIQHPGVRICRIPGYE